MRYELKYEDYSKNAVFPVHDDILVLVCEDGHKEIFRAVSEPEPYRCYKCHLSNRSDYCIGIDCGHWNFTCSHGCRTIYKSIDTILEDL